MLNRAHLRAQSSAHLREHVYQPTSSRSCLILRLIISFDIWHRFLDILLRWEYMAVVADMKTNSSFIILSTALENVGSQTQRGPVARFSLLGRLMGWHTEGQLLAKFSGMRRIIETHCNALWHPPWTWPGMLYRTGPPPWSLSAPALESS